MVMRLNAVTDREKAENKRQMFQKFVVEHRKKIYHLAYDLTGSRDEAEDLSQDVFLKAYKSLHSFREDASMYTWLYRITVTTFIDLKRKKSSKAQALTDELDESRLGHSFGGQAESAPASGPEGLFMREQLSKRIERALSLLSEKERCVFMLKHQSELKIDEIASMMDIAPGTVKSFLFRGAQKLRTALKKGDGDPLGCGGVS